MIATINTNTTIAITTTKPLRSIVQMIGGVLGRFRIMGVSSQNQAVVARTSVFEVRGSSLAKAPNCQDGRPPSGWGAREGRTADLNRGGLHCNTAHSCFLNKKVSLPATSCATAILAVLGGHPARALAGAGRSRDSGRDAHVTSEGPAFPSMLRVRKYGVVAPVILALWWRL